MSKPKVLIIGQPFLLNSGGGVTLSNLFRGWEPDQLAVACLGHLLEGELDRAVCENYYSLGSREYKWLFPFNLINRKYHSGPLKFEEASPKKVGTKKSKTRVKLIKKLFIPSLEYIGIFHLLSRLEISAEFLEWIEDFQPDIIYAQAPTRETLNFCKALQQTLRKPMVYHMMDDWPSTIIHGGFFSKYWQKVIDRELRALLDQASVLMSISDYMSEAYLKRYQKVFVPFHNPVNVGFWKKTQRKHYHLSNTPDMLYAGRIGLGIQSSLKKTAQAVEEVNQRLRIKMTLTVQSPERPGWIDDYSCTRYRKPVPYKELPRVFSEADFLLIPYDFSTTANAFIKYSMPTKAPEYMASGTPILIFSPADTALVQYANGANWAKVVTQNSTEQLTTAIQELVIDEQERQQIAGNAVTLAENRHDQTVVSRGFQELIISTVDHLKQKDIKSE